MAKWSLMRHRPTLNGMMTDRVTGFSGMIMATDVGTKYIIDFFLVDLVHGKILNQWPYLSGLITTKSESNTIALIELFGHNGVVIA